MIRQKIRAIWLVIKCTNVLCITHNHKYDSYTINLR